jgi:hypothetical protein
MYGYRVLSSEGVALVCRVCGREEVLGAVVWDCGAGGVVTFAREKGRERVWECEVDGGVVGDEG